MAIESMAHLTLEVSGSYGLRMRMRNVVPRFFVLIVTLLALSLPLRTPASPDSINLQLASPDTISASPREVITIGIQITSTEPEPRTFIISAEIPSGWSYTAIPDRLVIDPSSQASSFISVSIPSDAFVGSHVISLIASPEENPAHSVSVNVTVNVEAVQSLEVSAVRPGKAEASTGDVISQTYSIINRGNTTTQVIIEIQSYPDWPLVINPPDLSPVLDPGQEWTFDVQVTVPQELDRAMTHRLSVSVRYPDADPSITPAQTGTNTRVIPVKLTGSMYATLNGDLQLRTAFQNRDETGTQLSLDPLRSNLGNDRTLEIGLRNILIEGESSGTFLNNRRTWLYYSDLSDGYIHLGDIPLDLDSPLIERFMSGRGGDILLSGSPVDVRLLYARIHGSMERNHSGIQLIYPVEDFGIVRVTALRQSGYEQQESEDILPFDANIFSLSADISPIENTDFSIELGKSVSSYPGSSIAWRLTGSYNSEQFAASCEWLRAGAGFRGGWTDRESRRINLWWSPSHDFGVWSNVEHSRNNIEEDPGTETRNTRNAGIGAWFDIEQVGRLRMSHRNIHNWDGMLFSYDRETRLSVISLSRTIDNFTFTTTYERQTENDRMTSLTELNNNLRFELSARLTSFASMRLGYSCGRYTDNASDSSSRITNFTLGSQLRFSDDLRFSLNMQRYTGGIYGNRSDLNGALTWDLRRGHSLALRIRDFTDDFGNDTELMVEYEQPVSFPLALFPSRGSVTGRIFLYDSPDTGVSDVKIRLDGYEIVTGVNGEFTFPSLNPGQYELTVDPASLGIGMSLFSDAQIEVNVEAGETTGVDIPVIATSSISGSVFMVPKGYPGQAESTEPATGFTIELRSDAGSDFRLTDTLGNFIFTGLAAGHYTLVLLPENLPEDYEIRNPVSYEFDLAPGQSIENLDFTIAPIERPIVITTSGLIIRDS